MSRFQIIVLGVSAIAIIIAILFFSGLIPWSKDGGVRLARVTMWGTFDAREMRPIIFKFNEAHQGSFYIDYIEKSPENYKNELLSAMAAGNPPDIWLMSQDMIIDFKDKVYKVPFKTFELRKFLDLFLDAGENFVDKKENAIIALPFFIDPVVLYWNRDLFSSTGVAKVPQYWDEFIVTTADLTKKDNAGNIAQSGAALGEFRNVRNAKEILSMMILQTGNSIVRADEKGNFRVVWDEVSNNSGLSAAETPLIYFGDFSNPKKISYSWNRSLDDSTHMFTSGHLAMYFGYASEYRDIKEKNPHLNFDVAIVPQNKPVEGQPELKVTFSRVYALAIPKTSKKTQGALAIAFKLLDKEYNKIFPERFFLAPTRRDVLAEGHPNPVFSIFYKLAIMSRSWPEPDPLIVSEIFQNMIESTVTGKMTAGEVLIDSKKILEELYKEKLK